MGHEGLEITVILDPASRRPENILSLIFIFIFGHVYLDTIDVMLKILQARLQQYVNHELPDVQARFR